jgi:hypothetical protein
MSLDFGGVVPLPGPLPNRRVENRPPHPMRPCAASPELGFLPPGPVRPERPEIRQIEVILSRESGTLHMPISAASAGRWQSRRSSELERGRTGQIDDAKIGLRHEDVARLRQPKQSVAEHISVLPGEPSPRPRNAGSKRLGRSVA